MSFLIVRHPLERLLSAYRDKIQYAVSGSYHFKLGRDIIKQYRRKVRMLTVNNFKKKVIVILGITFHSFFKGTIGPKFPTYPEFIEWLVDSVRDGKPLDMHWTPVVEFCTPCMFDIKVRRIGTIYDLTVACSKSSSQNLTQ